MHEPTRDTMLRTAKAWTVVIGKSGDNGGLFRDKSCLCVFEPMDPEPQRSAVLGDGADDVVGGTVGEFHVDFERDLDGRYHEAGQVLNDFLGDPAGVASYPSGIKGH